MVKWDDYTAAARELSPSALNLFMYLAKNQDNYELWFSSKHYCETFGVVDKTFRNAKKELIAKGYLKEGENNHIYFDAQGGYKETIEGLKNRIEEVGEALRIADEKAYEDFKKVIFEAKLKEITSEVVYKIKIKELIAFGEESLARIARTEIKNMI